MRMELIQIKIFCVLHLLYADFSKYELAERESIYLNKSFIYTLEYEIWVAANDVMHLFS